MLTPTSFFHSYILTSVFFNDQQQIIPRPLSRGLNEPYPTARMSYEMYSIIEIYAKWIHNAYLCMGENTCVDCISIKHTIVRRRNSLKLHYNSENTCVDCISLKHTTVR